MEAAAAIKSYKGCSGGQQAHCAAKQPVHSLSVNASCRFPATAASASVTMCRQHKLKEGWLSTETRGRRRSKTGCESSLTNTFSTPCLTTTTAKTNINTVTKNINANTITTTTTHNNTHNDFVAPNFTRQPEHEELGVQELTVYEVNERDRSSPVLLFSSKLATDWYTRLHSVWNLGDLIPFSNKLFDGSLKKRLGITAGIISVIRFYPKEGGFLCEAIYSFYFGDYGHISVKGPYKSHKDTVLTVTGGSGIFNGVYGTVEISNVEFPMVLFYKFKLQGIPQLPQALRWKTIPPVKGLRPSHDASLPGIALPNFTD